MNRVFISLILVAASTQTQARPKPQEWIGSHNFECGLIDQVPRDPDDNRITRARIHVNIDEGTGVFKNADIRVITKYGDVQYRLDAFNILKMEKPDYADAFYWRGQSKTEPSLFAEGRLFLETKGRFKDRPMYVERLSNSGEPVAYAMYGCHVEDGD